MICYPGSATVVTHTFEPITLTGVTLVATDFNGNAIPVSGLTSDPSGEWQATVTIPVTAPICTTDSDYYNLAWTFGSVTTNYKFQVVGYDEGATLPPPAGLGVIGNKLYDELLLPSNTVPDTISVKLVDPLTNAVILAADPGDIVQVAGSVVNSHYTVSFPLISSAIVIGEYLLVWEYGVSPSSVATNQEYRQAFVIPAAIAGAISSLRMFIDQSGITKWLSHHHIHDVEIIDAMYLAAGVINPAPPQAWNFDPATLTRMLPMPMRQATLVEILSRLLLAEGMLAFDYQGGSITLNVDRTASLQSARDAAQNWLDTNLKPMKTVLARKSSSIGSLRITVSPSGRNNNFGVRGFLSAAPFRLSGYRPLLLI